MRVLGIHYSGSHDSSACFVEDGKLLYAVNEERFTRRTHDSVFPINAITQGFKSLNLRPEQMDHVVISWSSPYKHLLFDINLLLKHNFSFRSIPYFLNDHLKKIWINGGFRIYERYFGKANFLFCDHHLAHALSAYAYSGFKEATIVVVDGRGAFEATSIWHANGADVRPVEIIKWPNSLGLFYAKFTKYLGFQPLSDEWKVMGLAPYGKSGIDMSAFVDFSKKPYRVHWEKLYGRGLVDVSGIEAVFGRRRVPEDEIEDKYKDIAYAVQKTTENAMLETVRYAIGRTGSKNLCLAGGVVMNCKANGIIANSGLVDDIFIQPAATDDGAALGAAIYPTVMLEHKLPDWTMGHVYYGPSFKSDEIVRTLESYKIPYTRMSDPERTVAQMLADGLIIGLFNGRMEFGPRALGNRSILADPRIADMRDRVNNSVKYREWWRPFAPSVLEEHYKEYFDTKFMSPFMILSFPVKEEKRAQIPAVTHVDGTARPQTVSKKTNPFYWNIIQNFYQITGVPVLLNTSFNLKGEPIVCTPYDAIRTFYTSGLDALVIGGFLLQKNGGDPVPARIQNAS